VASKGKSDGKRKTEGTKEKTEFPKPGRKILTSKTLGELASSRAISEATLLAEFHSSLQSHRERAEDKLQKEFSGWLVKFAQAVDKNMIRTQAWEKLKSKCDALLLLHHLYLFTYFGTTTADVLQDSCRFLRKELDRLLPKCGALREDVSTVLNHPKLRLLSVLSEAVPQVFAEPLRSFAMAEGALRATRYWAEKMGSHKTEAHDLHLYALAASVLAATGEYHFPHLATLIEAARVAHGARHESVDEGVLKQRVQRYITRMHLARD
jgi:hypothetical protein